MSTRKLILILFAAFISLSFRGAGGHVVRNVFDGDTIQLLNGQKIRYFGIDTPEMGELPEFMAVEARETNRRLAAGKKVRLEFDHAIEDRHGRKLAYVFLEDGEMINLILVRKGLAHVLVSGPDAKYFSRLLENQRLAIRDGIGIWSKERKNPERTYIGNIRSYVFHRPGCFRAKEISRYNRNPFQDRRSAFWEGYHPCSICRP
jgi:endonuclease YncB( thermonuclease family)